MFKKMFTKKETTPQNNALVAGGKASSDWISTSLMSLFGNGKKTNTGITVDPYTALFNSAVFACQRGISESLAMIPIHTFDKKGSKRVAVENDPVNRLLNKEANSIVGAYNMRRVLEHHALSWGNGYAEIEFKKGTGIIENIWLLPPDKVLPILYDNNGKIDLVYEINLDGQPTYLAKDRVLHIQGLGFDGVRGYPSTLLMSESIGLGRAIEEFAATYFKNGGGGVTGYAKIPADTPDEHIINLRKHININNEGLDNAWRVKFFYDGIDFNPVPSGKPDESQMVQGRVFQIQEIARFYRYPLHKLQELSKAPSYNSLEQFNLEFVNDTLMPWSILWEQEINRKLFVNPKDQNKYVKFNFNALLRGDSAGRASFYRTMIMSGIMSRNEARILEELEPIDGADKLLEPLNMRGVGTERQLDAQERGGD